VNADSLQEILARVAAGDLVPDDAFGMLRDLPFADIGSARIDHHREIRVGVPEVVFGQGKTADEIVDVVSELRRKSPGCLVTRLSEEKAALVAPKVDGWDYDPRSQTAICGEVKREMGTETVVVASAGTSDEPVVSEALRTLQFLGLRSEVVRDVGVAGLPRLLDVRPTLDRATIVIVVAGMEGALATAVAGLVAAPVVAVPTSVGYGASFEGLAALLAMLSSCAPGVSVVNIDNGFGAAVVAAKMLNAVRRGD
jgi:NCAIR mutase (PurE)-related protein